MALPRHDRGRPVTTQTPSKLSITTDTPIVPTLDPNVVRCSRCRHPLTAAKSVELELGPVCRRADREVAA